MKALNGVISVSICIVTVILRQVFYPPAGRLEVGTGPAALPEDGSEFQVYLDMIYREWLAPCGNTSYEYGVIRRGSRHLP